MVELNSTKGSGILPTHAPLCMDLENIISFFSKFKQSNYTISTWCTSTLAWSYITSMLQVSFMKLN